jgi:peptidoglycan/xylan/chitin deacetylase (PgdA/CDA1 family)
MRLFYFVLFPLLCCTKVTPADSFIKTEQVTHKKNNLNISAFVHHRFDDSRFPSTNISSKVFETQLIWLLENNYNLITFSEAHTYLQKEDSDKKFVSITIDDAYKSFYEHGFPILKKHKITATLYVNTETVGANDYMTWEQLKEVSEYGIEIGNHTHTHRYFLNMPENIRYEHFEQEIKKSQELIKKNLSITPQSFSYPFGEFDTEMKEIVKRLGFSNAAAQNSGVMSSGSDPFMYPRFPMAEAYATLTEFKQKVKAKALPYTFISSTSHILQGDNNPPTLTISFTRKDINTKSLQCFVQGSACNILSNITQDSITTVSIKATEAIGKRRRTLYTITTPDKHGNWYWYSYLWVNPTKKE